MLLRETFDVHSDVHRNQIAALAVKTSGHGRHLFDPPRNCDVDQVSGADGPIGWVERNQSGSRHQDLDPGMGGAIAQRTDLVFALIEEVT